MILKVDIHHSHYPMLVVYYSWITKTFLVRQRFWELVLTQQQYGSFALEWGSDDIIRDLKINKLISCSHGISIKTSYRRLIFVSWTRSLESCENHLGNATRAETIPLKRKQWNDCIMYTGVRVSLRSRFDPGRGRDKWFSDIWFSLCVSGFK